MKTLALFLALLLPLAAQTNPTPPAASDDQAAEIARLRAENDRLQMQADAAATLAIVQKRNADLKMATASPSTFEAVKSLLRDRLASEMAMANHTQVFVVVPNDLGLLEACSDPQNPSHALALKSIIAGDNQAIINVGKLVDAAAAQLGSLPTAVTPAEATARKVFALKLSAMHKLVASLTAVPRPPISEDWRYPIRDLLAALP